jgi:NAD(P)-dependent dehydrogenase (short-subunit alcohol dehydrogenase family)
MTTKAIHFDDRRAQLIRKIFFLQGVFGKKQAFVLPISRAPQQAKPELSLQGKIVLVTGGSRGIGRAACELFAQAGCVVIGTSRHPETITNPPVGCTLTKLDVRDEQSVKNCIDAVIQKHGRIDILVNNAGIGQYGRLITARTEDWIKLFEVNLFGVHRVTVAAYPHMKGPASRIITMGSLEGEIGYPYQAIYAVGKRALQMWSDMFMIEQRREKGPTFTVLEPSWVKTGFGTSDDVVNTEPATTDPYARLNPKTFGWLTEHYGIEPELVGQAIVAIAATKKPKVRYFVGPEGPVLQGKSLEEVLEIVLTKPSEETLAFFEMMIDFLYALFAQ